MGHKAGSEFFAEKREWSKRKDQVLGYYLLPYLAHVARIGRPILLVDGFAGPGRFGDGEPGSPLIICDVVQKAIARTPRSEVSVICVEPHGDLFATLKRELATFAFASARQQRFGDFLPEVEAKYAGHTVFLYLDPFALEGIEWNAIDRVFSQIAAGRSVEVLWNFNVVAFARVGRSVLGTSRIDEEAGLDAVADAWIAEGSESGEILDVLAGPGWWRTILSKDASFDVVVAELAEGFCERLRSRFAEIAMHVIRDDPRHRLPKYVLAFGSRHPDAIPLMNDAMHQALRSFLARPSGVQGALFDARPFNELPKPENLPGIVEELAVHEMTRGSLIQAVMRPHIGQYSETEIRRAIQGLLNSGALESATGRKRVNDQVAIRRRGSAPGL